MGINIEGLKNLNAGHHSSLSNHNIQICNILKLVTYHLGDMPKCSKSVINCSRRESYYCTILPNHVQDVLLYSEQAKFVQNLRI